MTETRLWIAAACFFAVAVLGAFVGTRPPTAFDIAGGAIRGEALPLAAFFTLLGRWYVLTLVAAGAVAVTIALRGDPRAIVVQFASQVVAQGAVAIVKAIVHRPRPAGWLLFHEPDASYPSGHAVTSIVFYLGLALLVARSDAVPRGVAIPVAIACALCVAGIPWSRLALDAHYATDVIGGLIFGCGWLCATIALAAHVARV